MRLTQSILVSTLQRVQRFLDANAASLAAVNHSQHRATLDDIVRTLSAPHVTRATAKRLAARHEAKARSVRESLKLNHMKPIATAAAAHLRDVPEFLAFAMPSHKSTSRELIDSAGAMGTAAANYIHTLVDAGLPADFLASLARAIDAVSALADQRRNTKYGPAGATRLGVFSPRARNVLDALDSLVDPLIANDDSLITQWEDAKRFGETPGPHARSSLLAADQATPL